MIKRLEKSISQPETKATKRKMSLEGSLRVRGNEMSPAGKADKLEEDKEDRPEDKLQGNLITCVEMNKAEEHQRVLAEMNLPPAEPHPTKKVGKTRNSQKIK